MGTNATLFLISSCAGALSMGVTMTQSQTEESYFAGDTYRGALAQLYAKLIMKFTGIKRLNEFLPADKFCGKSYPATIMTDDCDALRNALRRVWPKSKLLLCHFHVMQAVWRWLWSAEKKGGKKDWKTLIILFRAILYSPTDEEANTNYAKFKRSSIAKKYPDFLT